MRSQSIAVAESRESIAALALVSKKHWYPPVRAAAEGAITTIRGGPTPKREGPAGIPPPEFFDYEHAGEKLGSFDYDEIKSLRFATATDQYPPVKVTVQKPGEWGGQIGFIDATGKAQVFAHENTEAIYQTAHGILAVTGLAHLSMNHGAIVKLSKGADGAWTAEKWRILPGAPRCSRLLADGRIIVSCYGGIVLVSPDGGMKSLTRRDALKQR